MTHSTRRFRLPTDAGVDAGLSSRSWVREGVPDARPAEAGMRIMKPGAGRSGSVGVLGAELSSSVTAAAAVRACTVGGCSRMLSGEGTRLEDDMANGATAIGGGQGGAMGRARRP